MSEKDNIGEWICLLPFIYWQWIFLLPFIYFVAIPVISFIIIHYQGLFYSIIALLVIVGIVSFIWYRKLKSNKDKLNDSYQNLKNNWKE